MFSKDWSTELFLTFYPEARSVIPEEVLEDPNYMVRSEHFNNGLLYRFEFGFADDVWEIPEPQNNFENLETN